MFFYLFATDRTVGTTNSGIQQAHKFINFRAGAYGTAWVTAGNLLLYGYGWWNALDVVTFGLVHTPQELAGICRETFNIPALSLGIKRIKGKGTLAAPA